MRSVVACAVGILLVFFPLFWGEILFQRDIAHWVYPARDYLRAAVQEGSWPAWRPHEGLGFSVHGDPLYGVFYPPNWLFLLVGKAGVAWMATIQVAMHVAIGGFGSYRLARRMGADAWGAWVAGFAWMLSGVVGAMISTGLLVLAAAWLPWQAVGQLALLDAVRAGGRRMFAGAAKAALPLACALLLGEVFLACVGFVAGVWMAMVTVASEQPLRRLCSWRLLAGYGLLIALGVSLGMASVGPAFIGRSGTERALSLSRHVAEAWSFHPLRTMELALPRSVGVNEDLHPHLALVGDTQVDGGPMTYNAYAGISILALALIAVSRRNRLSLGLAVGAVFFLLLAFGKHLPVHGVWRVLLPPLSYMRYPEKYLLCVALFLAPLAAIGAKRLTEGEGRLRLVGVVGAVVAVVVCSRVLSAVSFYPFVFPAAVHAMLVLAALGVTYVVAGRWRRMIPVWLLAVVVGDLWLGRLGANTWMPGELAIAPPVAVEAIHRDFTGEKRIAPPRLFRAMGAFAAALRASPPLSQQGKELLALRTLVPNVPTAHGIAVVPGYDVGLDPGFLAFWSRGLAQGQAVLRLLSVDYALLAAPAAGKPERSGLLPLGDPAPGTRLYRVVGSLPRVYVPAEIVRVPDGAQPEGLLAPEVHSGFRAWVSDGRTEEMRRSSPPGICEGIASQMNRLEARCRMDAAGVAVFVEQFAPGWVATVDGHETPLLRTNLFMRGVRVPEGEHVVRMTFVPPARAFSLLVSLCGMFACLGCLFAGRRRRAEATISGSA